MNRLLLILVSGVLAAASGIAAQTTLTVPAIGAGAVPDLSATPSGKPLPLTASRAFADAPLEIFPTIDRTTRLDMIDYYNSGSAKPSKNAFKGDARVLSLSDAQITFSTSDIQQVELSLIPHKSDTLIMVITTIKTPVDDSDVRFYTSGWKPVKDRLFIVPQLSDWMTAEAEPRKSDLENLFPITLARCVYEPSTGTLTIENKLGDFLPEDQVAWAKGLLHAKLVYQWNGKKMERKK